MSNLLDQATRDPVLAFILLLGVALVAAIVARVVTTAVRYGNTKVCDACKSRIPINARKCAHCGEAFVAGVADPNAPRYRDDDPSGGGFGG